MLQYIQNLLNRDRTADETGASAVEYGLLIAGIAAVIVVAVMALGPVLQDKFGDTCDAVSGAACAR
jgi:pilus assembly protein Flp/PilA